MTKDLATEIVKFIQADLESQWGELGRAFEDLDVEASHGITAGWLAGISEILEEDEKDQFVNRNPRQIKHLIEHKLITTKEQLYGALAFASSQFHYGYPYPESAQEEARNLLNRQVDLIWAQLSDETALDHLA